MAAVEVLKRALSQQFPNAQPVVYRTAGAVATGVAALDAMLPGQGLPRGRLVVWAPGGGVTAVLRQAAVSVIAGGERAAWIDAAQVITGASRVQGSLLVRPRTPAAALECAEELLRSGGFALVVVAGAAGVERAAVRLSRAVKEGGSAFIAVAAHLPVAHMRIRSIIDPHGYRWKLNPFGEPAHVDAVRLRIEASAMGWSGQAEVVLPVHCALQRTALDPLLPDRRGVKARKSHSRHSSRS